MADFDNLFDAALAGANDVILRNMGVTAVITSGHLEGTGITGVFDDPENITYVAGGIRIEDTLPSLFVKSSDILRLHRNDELVIGSDSFTVDRITPDDGGCSYIRLRRKEVQAGTRTGRYYEGA
ncbi:head-tail joining protein [Escherichia coli]|nr:head-tail joining protein [Escherichia coli]MEB7742348.1 head-tail joining protein [Escherichia coli]